MMSQYGYGGGDPIVPPRRKRSLSTTRADSNYDRSRLQRNLSTDQIPNEHMYAALQRPSMNSYYRQPTYNSSGNLHHGYSRAPVPNFINPMVSSSNRSHQDYLKYASGSNVSYNPYQTTNINPSLMARPTIEPFQNTNISQSVADAIARGRDTSLYSSKEQLNGNHGYSGRSVPPERPPPPRYGSRYSVENMQNSENFELGITGRSHFRDRRSVSPTRLSPTHHPQNPYNTRRSTSPMPSSHMLTGGSRSPDIISPSLSRSGSRSSINHQSNSMFNYSSRMSRESSPSMLRMTSHSPSPLNSPTLTTSPYTYDSMSIRQPMETLHPPALGNGQTSSMNEMDDMVNAYDVHSKMNVQQIRTSPIETRQFSENFTDHCDQYKSLTSKILSKNSNNKTSSSINDRQSGDFTDRSIPDGVMSNNMYDINHEYISNMCELDRRSREPSPMLDTISQMEINQQQSMADLNNQSTIPLNHDAVVTNLSLSMATNKDNHLMPIKNGGNQSLVRRTSTANGPSGQQRKGSLPGGYMANANAISLPQEWSRENVAYMAHEARQRLQNPSNRTSETFKKIGKFLTRQFAFVLIAGLNVLFAYIFYNLLMMLPTD
ncbi:hypothetical protein RDWZM_005070 [Blomia tropicalis]|uniref:Uncharacterized protein n=1 Tax=Blomia tropicalis TaxID=40697 RepID=A0A9Q0M3C1_BLOTA|nr:hypothetical protein RDWZM_005070 [Blomia tropicalis]